MFLQQKNLLLEVKSNNCIEMPYTYDYPRPALTVDAVVFRKNAKQLEVLLIQRKHYPFKGMWALPGGFVEMDETVETAVVRELEEETNLKLEGLEQLHTFSELGRDPRGRTVSVTFFGERSIDQEDGGCPLGLLAHVFLLRRRH